MNVSDRIQLSFGSGDNYMRSEGFFIPTYSPGTHILIFFTRSVKCVRCFSPAGRTVRIILRAVWRNSRVKEPKARVTNMPSEEFFTYSSGAYTHFLH